MVGYLAVLVSINYSSETQNVETCTRTEQCHTSFFKTVFFSEIERMVKYRIVYMPATVKFG